MKDYILFHKYADILILIKYLFKWNRLSELYANSLKVIRWGNCYFLRKAKRVGE